MGYWKDVSYDIQRGMSRKTAERVNAQLRYGNLTKDERDTIIAEGEADIKMNSML